MDFRRQADSPALLAEVKQHAAFLGNVLQRGRQLASAIAALGLENIAGQALRVDPHECRFFRIDHAPAHGEVVAGIGGNPVEMAVELAEVGRHFHRLLADHELLGAPAVFDELGDGAGLETVALLIVAELADAGHRAVVVHDLANHRRLRQSGETGEVERRLGVSGPAEHSVHHGLQRENMAGTHERIRADARVGEQLDGQRAVGGGNPGGVICGSSSSSARSAVTGAQINPRA